MTEGRQIALAEHIATTAHEGQVDKAGEPYIGHPARVAALVRALGGDDDAVVAAWLHDVLEDTSWTAAALEEAGISVRVVEAVVALTRTRAVPAQDYYANIRVRPLALVVKHADILDNLGETRLAALDQETQRRLRTKYALALSLLGIDPPSG